ncbi:MAG: TIGR03619 family F420-dependent LLM class oxidoreductase [Actinomycetota bacterium]|nr:TIGR03619 family F420-dependent LLM class oxidoreductase [Actinomycetota bacterium]
MQIGLYAHTHGVGYRDDTHNYTRSVPAHTLRPVEVAQAAERAGFHSMWFPDHVCMPLETSSAHIANQTGKRSYSPRHEMLDAAVVMGSVAGATSTLKLGTSVLIAPYRGPLNDMRQFTTVDVLSGGRLLLGVGAGWMAEEFAALGVPFAERGKRTEECIEIYKRCWTDDVVDFSGEFYDIHDVSMDPKPIQNPRPPIIYGGVAPLGARRAARLCDGLYPVFLDPQADPARLGHLHDIVRDELDALGRDPATFTMMAASTLRLTEPTDALSTQTPRPICTGTPDQVLADLERFAECGYSLVVCKMDCRSGEVGEIIEQIERVGRDIIPTAAGITAAGDWNPAL